MYSTHSLDSFNTNFLPVSHQNVKRLRLWMSNTIFIQIPRNLVYQSSSIFHKYALCIERSNMHFNFALSQSRCLRWMNWIAHRHRIFMLLLCIGLSWSWHITILMKPRSFTLFSGCCWRNVTMMMRTLCIWIRFSWSVRVEPWRVIVFSKFHDFLI